MSAGLETHPEFRYDQAHDVVLVRCEITGYWWTALEPEAAPYCSGCSEPVVVPAEARRPCGSPSCPNKCGHPACWYCGPSLQEPAQ